MKQTRLLMGMPITVEIADGGATQQIFDKVYDYFQQVDNRYSTYKKDSEISKINRGLPKKRWSAQMKQVLKLCELTKQETDGFFDIARGGQLDPSGLVKGWAIQNAAAILQRCGYRNFYIDAGGDIQASGGGTAREVWRVGLRNPFNRRQIIKAIGLNSQAVATSGSYIRGQHIYNPHQPHQPLTEIVSITVIGPDIYNADRYATAAYAMGRRGIEFIEKLRGYEAYMVDQNKVATMTSGFESYAV